MTSESGTAPTENQAPPSTTQTDQPPQDPPTVPTATPPVQSKPSAAENTGSASPSGITRDPATILVTADEAGKQAALKTDTSKDEGQARWAQRRYERERENQDSNTGPIVVDSQVWIARDVAIAQSIFKEQTSWNDSFPESTDPRKGSFEFKIAKLGDETSSIGACDDCSANRDYDKHFRVVFRKGTTVSVLYLFGHENAVPESLVLWYARNVLNRMP